MKNKKKLIQYLVFDYFMASLAWLLFFSFRRFYIESFIYGEKLLVKLETKLILGILIIPLFWIFLYYLFGYYKDIYRKSRLKEIASTFIQSFSGSIIIFFILMLDDIVASYKDYYLLFITYLALHFSLTIIARLILATITINNIKKGRLFFNTIIIGNYQKSIDTYNILKSQEWLTGNRIIGFVNFKYPTEDHVNNIIKYLGSLKNIRTIINKNNVKEVIIALDPSEQKYMNDVINALAINDIIINALPDMNDILTGKVKITNLFAVPLIQISHDLMPVWQVYIKQLADIIIPVITLILLSPLIVFLILYIKLTSEGPVIHIQERIGKFGKPFKLYKFRSMYADAERNGPELSSRDDPRLTRIGQFMRKFRLDEIPNFINVFKGDMSLVGPRPERQFYIDKIIEIAPHYVHLQKVKPGITSWGQVKYGYANNIEQMVRRLEYDLLYIENMSLLMDIKIIVFTILTILKGKGI